jgi:PAS domain S-box-containing protein
MTLMAAASTLAMSGSFTTALPSILAALGFGWAYWAARNPERASFGGSLIVVTAALQYVATALAIHEPAHALSTAYFAALLPLVAAATMRVRGVVLSGLVGAVSLVAQGWLRDRAGGSWQELVGAFYYFAATWVVAVFAAAASERALRSHVKEELRASHALVQTREAEGRYRLVAEQVSDLVSVLDDQGRFVYVSPSHERVLGIDIAGSLGRAAPELVHPDDYRAISESFLKTLQVGSAFTVARLQARDGEYRWFHIRFSRIGEGSDVGGTVATSARDITEQQRLTEALEGTRRMESLGRLAGGVAHDFNNLLLVIQACTDLAARQLPEPHPARADLKDVLRTTERAAALTKQLLTFARRQVLPARERSLVSGVVQELAPILERVCGKSIRVAFELAESGSEVNASSVELEQIVMNLTSNARDAMPEGGSLAIAVRTKTLKEGEVEDLREGWYVELAFKDSGVGMSPEILARIFEPFFTTKPAGRGTGLGLATVFGLVAQLGGNIAVSSVEGQGTEFRVLLPGALNEVTSATVRGPHATKKSLRVLVVDDEEVVRTLIGRILEAAGHHVTPAASAESAILTAKSSAAQFDLILTDVVLGAADGLAVLDTLRGAHPQAAVVVMSGYSPTPERVAALSRQGAEFLPKPFGALQLMAALERARPAS